MHLEKKVLLKKLLDQGCTPKSENFESCVKSLLTEKISEECDINLLSADTLEKIDHDARLFKYKMLSLWKDKKVLSRPDRLLAHTSGIFIIPVEKVGPEILGPSTSGPGRPPKPFSEKDVRAKQIEAASIAKNQDARALVQVPTNYLPTYK